MILRSGLHLKTFPQLFFTFYLCLVLTKSKETTESAAHFYAKTSFEIVCMIAAVSKNYTTKCC